MKSRGVFISSLKGWRVNWGCNLMMVELKTDWKGYGLDSKQCCC